MAYWNTAFAGGWDPCISAGYDLYATYEEQLSEVSKAGRHLVFWRKCWYRLHLRDSCSLTNENVMTAFKASGVISDSLGNLLFFSNGKKVWDRNFNIMPKGTNLSGDIGVTQPCIIIPKPESDSLYYLFTLDVMAFMPDNSYTTRGLTYSIVDMSRNGGMGNIGDSLNRSAAYTCHTEDHRREKRE